MLECIAWIAISGIFVTLALRLTVALPVSAINCISLAPLHEHCAVCHQHYRCILPLTALSVLTLSVLAYCSMKDAYG